jgi:hypothetical protein
MGQKFPHTLYEVEKDQVKKSYMRKSSLIHKEMRKKVMQDPKKLLFKYDFAPVLFQTKYMVLKGTKINIGKSQGVLWEFSSTCWLKVT